MVARWPEVKVPPPIPGVTMGRREGEPYLFDPSATKR